MNIVFKLVVTTDLNEAPQIIAIGSLERVVLVLRHLYPDVSFLTPDELMNLATPTGVRAYQWSGVDTQGNGVIVNVSRGPYVVAQIADHFGTQGA